MKDILIIEYFWDSFENGRQFVNALSIVLFAALSAAYLQLVKNIKCSLDRLILGFGYPCMMPAIAGLSYMLVIAPLLTLIISATVAIIAILSFRLFA